MRKGEALALTWPQVDAERREIRIWPSEEWQPKNGRPREVPISERSRNRVEVERRSQVIRCLSPLIGEKA
jgi:integrase